MAFTVSLRIVLTILIAVMSLVIALTAFIPTYLSGLESMDSVMTDLRGSYVGRAREAFDKFMDVPRLQLKQAYYQVNSGLVADLRNDRTALVKWLVDTTSSNAGLFSTLTFAYYNATGDGNLTYFYCDSDQDPTGIIIGQFEENSTSGMAGLQLQGIDADTYQPRQTFLNIFRPTPKPWLANKVESIIAVEAPEVEAIQYPTLRYGWSYPVRLITSFVLGAIVDLRDPQGNHVGVIQAGMKTNDIDRVLNSLNLRTRAAGFAFEAFSRVLVGTSWGEELFFLSTVYSDTSYADWERISLLTLTNFTGNNQMKDEVVPFLGLSTLYDTRNTLEMETEMQLKNVGRTFLSVFEVYQTGMKLRVVLAMPEIDFLESIKKSRTASIAATVCTFVVTLLLGVLCAQLIVAPLLVLRHRMALTASFRDEAVSGEEESMSFMSEVAGMQDSYLAMRDELNKAKVYLPQSVLQARTSGTTDDNDGGGSDDDEGSIDGGVGDSCATTPRPQINIEGSPSTGSTPQGTPRGGGLSIPKSLRSNNREGSAYRGEVGSTATSGATGLGGGGYHHGAAVVGLNTNVSLASKKVSIAVFNLQSFQRCRGGQVEMVRVQTKYLEAITKHVKQHKGVVDYFQGDRVICSFNAVSNCAGHVRRAVHAAKAVVHDCERMDQMPSVTVGVSSGIATVGNMGTQDLRRFCIVGQVVIQALILERLNKHFKTKIVAPGPAVEDLSTDYYLQHVGICKLPRWKQADAPVIITSIGNSKTGGGGHNNTINSNNNNIGDGGVEMDEWMYEMEASSKKDPFFTGNQIMQALIDDGPQAARSLFEKALISAGGNSSSEGAEQSSQQQNSQQRPTDFALPGQEVDKSSKQQEFDAFAGARRILHCIEAAESSSSDFGTPSGVIADCFF